MVEYYNKEIAGNDQVELIWATADNSEDDMEAWAKTEKFPWPTIKFKAVDKIDEIQKLAPRGVPGYVLVDADGKVLASTAGNSEPVKKKLKELTEDDEA